MHGWHCYIFKTYLPDKLSKLRTTGYSPGRIYVLIRPGEYKKLFARANIYGYSPGRIYMVIRSGEYIWLFALANILESGYSPG